METQLIFKTWGRTLQEFPCAGFSEKGGFLCGKPGQNWWNFQSQAERAKSCERGKTLSRSAYGKQERWLLVVWDSNEVWGHQSVVASVHSVAHFFFFNSPSVQQQHSDDNTDEADLCVYPR